jgi:hypothetical protein
MVKDRRKQIGMLAVLAVLAALSLYYGFHSVPQGPAARQGKAKTASSFELDEVLPIDLARVEKLRQAAGKDDTEAGMDPESGLGEGGRTASRATVTPPPPQATPQPDVAPPVPSPPPMNLRYLGAVQVPDGSWVAALVTDRKELLTGKEGDVIANRFRIVKIGVESIDLLETASGRQRRMRLGGGS